MALNPDRLFPIEAEARHIARRLYNQVKDLPIISPHGHTDPLWYAEDKNFSDPASLFVKPDHYVFRMLYSQGVGLEKLGIKRRDGGVVEEDARQIWREFARHWYLFRATPSRLWFEHALENVFGISERLHEGNADALYDRIAARLGDADMRPRALYEKFHIEVIATTDGADDDLAAHDVIAASRWHGRVIPTYRPDAVVDPQHPDFKENLVRFIEKAGTSMNWQGYLEAHRIRRDYFKKRGATATDHGHPSARTANLGMMEASSLFERVRQGDVSAQEAELFRAQMLTEMARMSLDDRLVMQLHPGSFRNHNAYLFEHFGCDMGADIPRRTNYVDDLKPLLDAYGNDKNLTFIVFTLDESSYARELAPLAGHYPALRLGPAWWFFDSPEGMRRYRELTTETAGFYNTVGFNDDTRAYLSIPARHDMARRVDCAYLARLVCDHRLDEDEAHEIAHDLSYRLAKQAYRL